MISQLERPALTRGMPMQMQPSSRETRTRELKKIIQTRVVRLSAGVIGTVFGTLAGALLFLATNFLLLKGGKVVGPHLALLSQVYPGYRVSFVGSFIGFGYAFVTGWAIGFAGAWLYNTIASFRSR